jgi:hypothetical protein
MNTWLQACDSARQELKSVVSMLLDQECYELFLIGDNLSSLGSEVDEKDYSTAVPCGLFAASYRIAGSVKIVANAAMQASTAVDKLAVSGRGVKKKLINHQLAIKEFAKALCDDCSSDLMHLTSEIDVILEHPFVVADDSLHSRLQGMHDTLEAHVESLYEMGSQLKCHPIMGIDTEFIGTLKVIHKKSG